MQVIGILVVLWAIILVVVAVHYLRGDSSTRSIEHFHAEHEHLSRQGYSVEPAHRLNDHAPSIAYETPSRRPHLTVVHDDDTYQSLEARGSWDEWSRRYAFDDEPLLHEAATRNTYARAYASAPYEAPVGEAAPRRRRAARAQRRMILTRTALAAAVLSGLDYLGVTIVADLALVAWMALVGYVALIFFAVSRGWIGQRATTGTPQAERDVRGATIAPMRTAPAVDDEFYDPSSAGWQYETQPRRAFG